MTYANTYAKRSTWLIKHFGEEGYRVIEGGTPYGYRVTVSATPERSGRLFMVHKLTMVGDGGGFSTRLGVFDTSEEAVNMLRLLIATERNQNETVDESAG